MNKKFERWLYAENDPIGKKAITDYLETKNVEITEHPEGKYNIDLMGVNTSGSVFYYDAEIRSCWNGGDWTYSTIHIPARKCKYQDIPNAYCVVVSNKLLDFLFIPTSEMKKSNIVNIWIERTKMYEDFYDVQYHKSFYFSWSGSYISN